MKRKYLVDVEATVEIVIDHDHRSEYGDALDPRRMEGIYGRVESREDMLRHLAYNAVANGYGTADRLDGWADLPRDTVAMDVRDVDVLDVGEGDPVGGAAA